MTNHNQYSLVKEMLIAYVIGGALGLLLLAGAEVLVEFLKK